MSMLPALTADPVRFETLFDLLSLDLCDGTFEAMNLVEPAPGALRTTLQTVMDSEAYSKGDRNTRLALMAAAFEAFPEVYRERLLRWSRVEFQYGRGQDHGAFFWRQILLRAAHEPDGKTWMSRAAVSLLARMEAAPAPALPAVTDRDIRRLADYHARHGDTPMASPLELVTATIAHVAFFRSWEEALRTEPDRAAAFTEAITWARRRATALGMPKELLGDPRTWPPLLTTWT